LRASRYNPVENALHFTLTGCYARISSQGKTWRPA
jgi:hypothetical protein